MMISRGFNKNIKMPFYQHESPPPLYSPSKKSLNHISSTKSINSILPPLVTSPGYGPITHTISSSVIDQQQKQRGYHENFEPQECISRLIILKKDLQQSQIIEEIPIKEIPLKNDSSSEMRGKNVQKEKKLWKKQFLKNTSIGGTVNNINYGEYKPVDPGSFQRSYIPNIPQTKQDEKKTLVRQQNHKQQQIPPLKIQQSEPSKIDQTAEPQTPKPSQLQNLTFKLYNNTFNEHDQTSRSLIDFASSRKTVSRQQSTTSLRTKNNQIKLKQLLTSPNQLKQYLNKQLQLQISLFQSRKLDQLINKGLQPQSSQKNLQLLRCLLLKLKTKKIGVSITNSQTEKEKVITFENEDQCTQIQQYKKRINTLSKELEQRDQYLEDVKRNYDDIVNNLVTSIANISGGLKRSRSSAVFNMPKDEESEVNEFDVFGIKDGNGAIIMNYRGSKDLTFKKTESQYDQSLFQLQTSRQKNNPIQQQQFLQRNSKPQPKNEKVYHQEQPNTQYNSQLKGNGEPKPVYEPIPEIQAENNRQPPQQIQQNIHSLPQNQQNQFLPTNSTIPASP